MVSLFQLALRYLFETSWKNAALALKELTTPGG